MDAPGEPDPNAVPPDFGPGRDLKWVQLSFTNLLILGPLKGLIRPLKGLMRPLKGLIRLFKGLIRPFKGLIRPFKGLIRPFKGLIRLFKGLIRPFKGLIRLFKGLIRPLKAKALQPKNGWKDSCPATFKMSSVIGLRDHRDLWEEAVFFFSFG